MKKYDFSNFSNENVFENADTAFVDLNRGILRVIQSGNVHDAKQFIESELYQEYLSHLSAIPMYAETSYVYSCVICFTCAITAISKYKNAERLLRETTLKKFPSKDAYIRALPETILAFTALVEEDRKTKTTNRTVRRAISYIDDHLYADINLTDLASYCGCSLSFLRHRFKNEKGVSLLKYIRTQKIEKAKELLTGSDLTLAQISSQLAFCSESYFIARFREETGITPYQYRHHRHD